MSLFNCLIRGVFGSKAQDFTPDITPGCAGPTKRRGYARPLPFGRRTAASIARAGADRDGVGHSEGRRIGDGHGAEPCEGETRVKVLLRGDTTAGSPRPGLRSF